MAKAETKKTDVVEQTPPTELEQAEMDLAKRQKDHNDRVLLLEESEGSLAERLAKYEDDLKALLGNETVLSERQAAHEHNLSTLAQMETELEGLRAELEEQTDAVKKALVAAAAEEDATDDPNAPKVRIINDRSFEFDSEIYEIVAPTFSFAGTNYRREHVLKLKHVLKDIVAHCWMCRGEKRTEADFNNNGLLKLKHKPPTP